MYLMINGTTGLTVNDWILAGLSLNDFYNDSRRGDISIARRGKDGNTIIDVRSIRRPERIAAIEAKFGPIEQSETAALYQAKPDTEARVWYTAYAGSPEERVGDPAGRACESGQEGEDGRVVPGSNGVVQRAAGTVPLRRD